MQTNSPGTALPRRGVRQRWITVPRMLYAAPVVVFATYGALWIATHAGGGRSSTHALWQSLTLAEITLALLLRRWKPTGALAGILAAYLIFDLPWLTVPPILFALLLVAAIRDHRTAVFATTAVAAVVAAKLYLLGDATSLAGHSLLLLPGAGTVVAAGMYLRKTRARADGQAGTSGPWMLAAGVLGM